MPLVTVECPAGQLSRGQKSELADELTRLLIEIEGGGDTPFARAGTPVRYREFAKDDWYVGGRNDGTYGPIGGQTLVVIYVPEGLLTQTAKSEAHRAVTDAVAKVRGVGPTEARSIWVEVFEWPEGTLATGGSTVSLFGIAKRAGHAPDHPVLTYPRTYFDAKDRAYDAHGFPADVAGRSMNRY